MSARSTLQQHEICVSGKTDHNEWLTVLREHSAHHSIFNAYDVSKHLVGKGRYAEVYLGRDMLTRKRHALKMIKKANIDTVTSHSPAVRGIFLIKLSSARAMRAKCIASSPSVLMPVLSFLSHILSLILTNKKKMRIFAEL